MEVKKRFYVVDLAMLAKSKEETYLASLYYQTINSLGLPYESAVDDGSNSDYFKILSSSPNDRMAIRKIKGNVLREPEKVSESDFGILSSIPKYRSGRYEFTFKTYYADSSLAKSDFLETVVLIPSAELMRDIGELDPITDTWLAKFLHLIIGGRSYNMNLSVFHAARLLFPQKKSQPIE
jgi:hypothetical protein